MATRRKKKSLKARTNTDPSAEAAAAAVVKKPSKRATPATISRYGKKAA
jgi:hypothetical protein